MLQLHNQERSNSRLEPLKLDSGLNAAAQSQAEWMASHRRLKHQSLSPIMENWGTAGENIAQGQETEQEAMNSWMHSYGHRANILNKRYTHAGFGMAKDRNDIPYWSVVFGGK